MIRLLTTIVLFAATAVLLAACSSGDASPPSGRIVFTSTRDKKTEIYVLNLNGMQVTALTTDPSRNEEPGWSPDASRIAFTSRRNGNPDIWVMNADGSGARVLAQSPAEEGSPRWSPDGKTIAFYSFRQQRAGFLWLMNADGSDPRPVLAAIHPAPAKQPCAGGFPGGWIAGSTRIVYRGSEGDQHALQICSVNPDGSDIKVLYTQPNSQSSSPAVSDDGTKIVFAYTKASTHEIRVMNVGGSDMRTVVKDMGEVTNPTWSPDGNWIAFASKKTGYYHIYIVREDGSGLRQLTSGDGFEDVQPDWSPK